MRKMKLYLMFCAVIALCMVGCSKDETSAISQQDEKLVEVSFGATLNDLLNENRSQAINKDHNLLESLPECSDDAPLMAAVTLRPGDESNMDSSQDIVVDVQITGNAESGFFTVYDEDLKLPAGQYTLWAFMVYADEAMTDLIWLAPLDDGPGGGTLSEYTENPLPLAFNLFEGEKFYLDVEVLCFDERNVNEYGFQFFDLMPDIVYNFCFFA